MAKKSSSKSKSISNNTLLTALLYTLVGIMFIVFRSATLKWGLVAIGALTIVYGIIMIVNKNLVSGIIYLIIGILLIISAFLFLSYVLIALGALLVIQGIVYMLKELRGKKRTLNIIVALVTIIIGILLIVSKFVFFDWFLIIIGIVLIVDGILMLLGVKK